MVLDTRSPFLIFWTCVLFKVFPCLGTTSENELPGKQNDCMGRELLLKKQNNKYGQESWVLNARHSSYCYHTCHIHLEILLSFCAMGQWKPSSFPLLNVTGLGSALTAVGPLGSNVKCWSEAAPCALYSAFDVLIFSDIWIQQVFFYWSWLLRA